MRGVPVFDEAGFSEQHLGRIDLDSVRTDWLLLADGFSNGRIAGAVRRGVDIVVSLALLLLTLPLMLLTAALVRLESPGPVLYRQTRVGLHGEPFTLLKFRSMTVNAEGPASPVGRCNRTRASHASAALSGPCASTSYRSSSTCCAVK